VRRGIAAEFLTQESLLSAIRSFRTRGWKQLEAYSPVPSDEIDAALGSRRSPLSVVTGAGGLLGAASAYFLQWLLVAWLYPVDTGGRPPHMPLPFTIITVEMGFLGGALCAFVGFLVAARLLKLWDPIFEVPGFESATRASFWLAVDAADPKWDDAVVRSVLAAAQPARLHEVGGTR
jgi:hypothetical protein